jgi:alpha-L-fucosidase
MIRKLQPDIVIWNDGGDRGDLRWVGTESGYVGETNWSLLNGTGEVTWGMLHFGLENGDSWVPAEVNTSIRPEWFYHPSEDDKVKTVPQLMDIYYNSIGKNATLLLNFPIMPNGLIHEHDEKAALEFGATIKTSFAENMALKKKSSASNVRGNERKFDASKVLDENNDTFWTTDDSIKTASLVIDFDKPTLFNRFMAQEYIRLGQRIKSFTVEGFVNGTWQELAKGTTIGYKRILRFPAVEAIKVRFTIKDSKASPVISTIGIYTAPVSLDAPSITRNQSGEIIIETNDIGPYFYYTLDGSTPTQQSAKYIGPVLVNGKVEVRAIAYSPATGKSSPVAMERFDVSRKNWKIVSEDEKAAAILDGNVLTTWHQNNLAQMPVDLVVDLGSELQLVGFKYHPDQSVWGPGIITHYEFYVSSDNKNWERADAGEFANIKNNPLWQTRKFPKVKARYIKLRALKNSEGNANTGYAEIDVVTE